MYFDEFDLSDDVLDAISFMGFNQATPIQEKAIPAILNNNDVLGFAQTGTGKTAAFVLPVLHKISQNPSDTINTIIIVPTRELAIQIEQQIQGFSYFTSVNSIAIYGGGDGKGWITENNALSNHTNIVVATPGKLISHLNTGRVKLENLEHLILDEADRMLDMGFYEDIMKIVSFMPKKRQTLMFSATMAPKIKKMAKDLLSNPTEIQIELSKPAEGVLQLAYLTFDPNKIQLIDQLIADKPEYKSILIFTSTKSNVSKIVQQLKRKKYSVEGISSDLEQREREDVLARFRSKQTRILIGTDVVSRGIDIKGIELIINFDVPNDAEDYVHRIGRTARADSTGVAITFINEDDMFKFNRIEKLIDSEIMKLSTPQNIGKSPVWKMQQKESNSKKHYYKKKKGKR